MMLNFCFFFLGTPNLFLVETIDSDKLAKAVNTSWERLGNSDKLNVYVQVNTSGEESRWNAQYSGFN